LGLSVVDAVVKDHNGYIDLISKTGEGTSFLLYFPITRDKAGNRDTLSVVGGTEKILVVDDDEVQREVSTRLLKSLGYRVSSASSGEEALDMLQSTQFDLLILDMIMPGGIDGTRTYQHALEINPAQKALITSGFAESKRVEKALSMGARAFIKKPLTRKELASAVRSELDLEVKEEVR
jgi:CheY-like chemotaxis protein